MNITSSTDPHQYNALFDLRCNLLELIYKQHILDMLGWLRHTPPVADSADSSPAGGSRQNPKVGVNSDE